MSDTNELAFVVKSWVNFIETSSFYFSKGGSNHANYKTLLKNAFRIASIYLLLKIFFCDKINEFDIVKIVTKIQQYFPVPATPMAKKKVKKNKQKTATNATTEGDVYNVCFIDTLLLLL